jgi:hypothetical protein
MVTCRGIIEPLDNAELARVTPREERATMERFLITNVRVLDGTGREPFAGAVSIEGNRIAEVAAGTALPAPGATVIDGAGATLMPGLIESHAHIGLADMTSYELTRLPPEEHVLVTVRNARTMLDCGYTSAFSAAAPKPRLDVVLKREIEAGRVPGPRLLANGPEITVTGGLGDSNLLHLPHYETPTFSWVADGPDAIRRVCRVLAREGVDLLKLNLSGDIGTSSFPSEQTPMTEAEVAAAMEVARSAELRVAAHCRSAESVLMALRHGIEVIYHANWATNVRSTRWRRRATASSSGPRSASPTTSARPTASGACPSSARAPSSVSWRCRSRPWPACASAASGCCPAATTGSPTPPMAPTPATSGSSSRSSASRPWRPSKPPPGSAARSWACRASWGS